MAGTFGRAFHAVLGRITGMSEQGGKRRLRVPLSRLLISDMS